MSEVSSYDPLAPDTVADPFPAYAWLREQCPVHRTDQFGHPLYTVSRRADVHRILTDPWHWSNMRGPGVGYAGVERRGDLQRFDPPEHTSRRKFARAEFNPVQVQLLIEHTTPRADRQRIKAWADAMVQGLSDPYAAGPATEELRQYVLEMVQSVRAGKEIPDGLMKTYSMREFNGALMDEREMANMFSQLLVGGHETTTSLITNMVYRLLDRRELWERLLVDRSLCEAAVEESLRFDPPVLGLCRTNNDETELGEYHLEPGTKLMVLYASANRDPAAFTDPDTFSLDRPWSELRRHYSFGWGMHHCLGAPIARQTARVALETLLDRFPTLRLTGESERIAPEFLWGKRKLFVTW